MPAVAPFVPLIAGGLGLLGSRNAPDQQTTSQGGSSTGRQVTDATSTSQTNIDPRLQRQANSLLRQINAGGGIAPINRTTFDASGFVRNQLGQPLGMNPFATGANQNQFASGAGINPYLDEAFNTAAGATQNRLASEFARAGRYGSGANQQARSQELQTLASNIYGQGFEAERQRQFGATEANLGRQYGATESNLGRGYGLQSQALGLSPTIGSQIQSHQQALYDYPGQHVNQAISRLGALSPFFPSSVSQRNQGVQSQAGTSTGSQTTPLYNDPFSGFAGGALLGSVLSGQPLIPSLGKKVQPYQPPTAAINPYGFGGGFGGYGLA